MSAGPSHVYLPPWPDLGGGLPMPMPSEGWRSKRCTPLFISFFSTYLIVSLLCVFIASIFFPAASSFSLTALIVSFSSMLIPISTAAALMLAKMTGKNKGITSYSSIFQSDSEEYYDDDAGDSGSDYDLSLEKLNLGPTKKLLVLSLNGLLVHRVFRGESEGIPKNRLADFRYGNYLVFKRPFIQEFIKFCLESFQVGIWSSAMEHNVDEVLDYATGPQRSKLLFVWDQSQCTDSGFKSLEKKTKPLFFKELKRVWRDVKKGGPYSEANTLFIDDEPYKALLNPPNTGIFPEPYNAEDKDDNFLDPKGELGSYLKGLAEANDVQSYVKQHSIGQPAITSDHSDWAYYSVVLHCLGNK
ncbi:putative C-terminal domain small phosphatase [Senna tora]|uniref:Mitochondrial import inner membrane translocase subunit TIM50 n=1 Tax=Senna tora TaxID=362788 RepID=A0A834TAU1_9FABA|nr:putative C-terminal domain small phosphatase [Senna tora]